MYIIQDDLKKILSDLNQIIEFDLTYLLVNRDVSFVDQSTLTMIQNKIQHSMHDLECLIHKSIEG